MLFETKKAIRNHPAYKKEKERIVKLLRLMKCVQAKKPDWIETCLITTLNRWKKRENEFYCMEDDSNIYILLEVKKLTPFVDEFHDAWKSNNSKEMRLYADAFGRNFFGDDNYEEKLKVLEEIAFINPFEMCYDMKFGGFYDGELFDNDKWFVIPIFMDDDFFRAHGCMSEKVKRLKHRDTLVDELNELEKMLTPLEFPKKPEAKTQPEQPTVKSKVTVNQTAPKQSTAQRPQPLYRAPVSEHKIISCPHCDGLVRYPRNILQRSYALSLCPHCGMHINLKNIN